MRIAACLAFLAVPLSAQTGPFAMDEAMRDQVRKVTVAHQFPQAKVKALLQYTFNSVEAGGLGMVYDNSRTRTVQEAWNERKANCITLTAYFVVACRYLGLEVGFAEAPGISNWRKTGGLIRHERHMVAVLDQRPFGVAVMDFLPELRKGFYVVDPITEDRALALWHANRAVEALETGNTEEALAEATRAVSLPGAGGTGWNTLGVVRREAKDPAGAEKAFLRALELDAKEGAACGNLESLYREMGRHEEADRYRAQAVKLRAKDPYFHAFLAREAMEEGDLVQADKELDQAIKLMDREPEFFILRAQISMLGGRNDRAVKALEQAKKWASPEERNRMDRKLAKIRNEA